MKNATYTSPKSQNEMIYVIGINTIQQQLINKIKDAKFHAVMADEVTSVNDELLSICFRYVDGPKDIREVSLPMLSWGSQHALRKIRNNFLDFETPIRLLQPIGALKTSTYHSPQHVNSL